MNESGIVFLMYHELEVPARPTVQSSPGYVRYVLRASEFGNQMTWLSRHGWRGMSVSEALTFPQHDGVAVTFDDGCETDLLVAAPILKEMSFGGTFYITSGFPGRPGHLSGGQLRELAQLGFEIGCHSMTHAYLTGLDSAGLHREIVDAKSELERILGQPVVHFSCPGGRYDRRSLEVAQRAGYHTVATSRVRANTKSTSLLELGRVALLRETSSQAFWAICRGRGLWQLRARDSLRGALRRVLGNTAYDRLREAWLGRTTTD
jgi:peptidoglycan/xylan/chitin deacetylase (PgdA/CDA1 family)